MPPMLAAQSEGRAKEDNQRSAAKGSKKGGSLRDLAYRFEAMPKNRSGLDAARRSCHVHALSTEDFLGAMFAELPF